MSPHPTSPGQISPPPEPVEGRGRFRRALILGAGAVGFANAVRAAPRDELAGIEAAMGGRLGVHAFDLTTGRTLGHRAEERFPMCSTFKALLVGAVLERVQTGALDLAQPIRYGAADLLEYAPVARVHVAEGALSLGALCAAAVELSDNTAANLLLKQVGGPRALTVRLRAWGDARTRLDRNEPALNSSIPGDPRDTTTPRAMASTLQRLLLGPTPLDAAHRALLLGWMRACQTGQTKLRAGLPPNALVGDKTGNNGHDTCGDNAIVELPGRRPIFISTYLTQAKIDAAGQDKVFVQVAHLVMRELAGVAPHG